jgi:hypothetical protein
MKTEPKPRIAVPQRYMIRDQRRCFLDTDNLRRWDTGIYQRFPKAEKVPLTGLEPGPVGAWDAARTSIYGSVLVETGLFRMWYNCECDPGTYAEAGDRFLPCYAESDDGIHWRKPDLKLTGQRIFPGNNLLPLPGALMNVVPALPGADYKYLACSVQVMPLAAGICDRHGFAFNGPGTYLFASDDGFRWRQLTDQPLVQHGDECTLYADPATGRYFLYQKIGLNHGLDTRRSWIGLESTDAVQWEGYSGQATWRECFVADDYDDMQAAARGLRIVDFYHMIPYRVGDLYVAVQSVFLIGDPLRQAFAQNPKGLACLRLAYSHNAMNWRYPKGRPAWLEQDAAGGFDAGFMVAAGNVLEHGDDLLTYYYGSPLEHGWCLTPDFKIRTDIPLETQHNSGRILLARIKRDRFAALAAPYQSVFDVENTTCMERTRTGRAHLEAGPRGGDALFVNASCPKGRIRVALVKHGETTPIPGFSLDDCIPFTGDSVRGPIRYRKAAIDRIPADQGLCLRFEVSSGEIYGYEWGN